MRAWSSVRGVKIGAAVALLGAAVAAAILLNLALLGYAQPRSDPVGNLSPRAALTPAATPPAGTVPARTVTVVTTRDRHENDD